MKKSTLASIKNKQFPVVVEKGEDGFYVVECSIFRGCYSQGKTLDEALENIREAITLCLEEKENQKAIKSHRLKELSIHTITL